MKNAINETKNKQWITAEIKASGKHKSLYMLSETTKSPIIKAYCTQYSTILQKVIRKAKHIYYKELIKYLETKIQHYGR